MRIGGEIGSLRSRSAANELRRGETVRQKATKYPLDLVPIIAKGLATYLQFIKTFHFCVFDSGYLLNLSLKLSCNVSDLMFVPVTLNVLCYEYF